jgi:uncharacterized phage-associated protein
MVATDSQPHTRLTPNVKRILAALYRAMTVARDRGHQVTQYDLLKTLFLADRAHLNEWGRPITYDNYSAMVHGPVPSVAYDLLKGNAKAMRDQSIKTLPWTSEQVSTSKGTRRFYPIPDAIDVEDYLSESDIASLDDAMTTVRRLGFGQIRRLTHEDPAYVDAWREGGTRAAYDMKLGLFFEDPNFEQAEIIAEHSAYV